MNNEISLNNRNPDGGVMAIATTRQSQEVQAAMIVAKQFPRDETAAIARLVRSCQRVGLAEVAMYAYPKGGTKVTGPSIRLAEAMAQSWGNIDYGVIELEQKPGESVAMAYAWDLETNVRRQMVFTVKHIRSSKDRGNVLLTDPRDIYEMVANQGARRVRSCILGVIPGDIEDLAVAECEKTLRAGSKEPISDRIRKMVIAFQGMQVTKAMIEARLGHNVDVCCEQDIVNLTKIFSSIRDGMSKREDWFEINIQEQGESKPTNRIDSAKAKMQRNQSPQQAPESAHPPLEPAEASQDQADHEEVTSVCRAVMELLPDKADRVSLYSSYGCDAVNGHWPRDGVENLWDWVTQRNEANKM